MIRRVDNSRLLIPLHIVSYGRSIGKRGIGDAWRSQLKLRRRGSKGEILLGMDGAGKRKGIKRSASFI